MLPPNEVISLSSLEELTCDYMTESAWVVFAPLLHVLRTCRDGEDWLSEQEKNRIEQQHFARDRQTRLGAYWLLRFLLAKIFNETPSLFRFGWHAAGKPYLDGADNFDVSLSHTDSWLAAGAAKAGLIGVDVEANARSVNWEEIAPLFLHAEEQRQMSTLTRPWQSNAFGLERWCLKEAFAKATGLGFALEPERLLPEPSGDGWRVTVDGYELIGRAINANTNATGAWAVSADVTAKVYVVSDI